MRSCTTRDGPRTCAPSLGHLCELPEASDDGTAEPRLAVMGFSLGGNATIKLLGEPLEGLPVFAGVAVSAPLDLAVGAEHLHHMAFGMYERYLLAGAAP